MHTLYITIIILILANRVYTEKKKAIKARSSNQTKGIAIRETYRTDLEF